ncbi:MAG TPA: DUF2461 domain-containing protein [Spirochaetia bacterium]|nr:DUF2461 domain-containing protein [Spirochaetia bacterium]
MAGDLDLGVALKFLARLRKNNNKGWFDANKDEYLEAAAQFESLVARLIEGLGRTEDLGDLTPKDCIMRIYRDVRFSKDKSPYKTGFGAGIAPGGRKSGRVGYHLHLAPGETMVATGLWDPTPEQLTRFRDSIVADASAFNRILGTAAFKKHFEGLWGEQLKTAPRGYPADHPSIDLLRRKQVCVTERFADGVVTSARFPALAVGSMEAMKPFAAYLDQVAMGRRR